MKKNDLIRKLSVIGAMVLVASTMVACSSSANYAPTSAATADDYSYAQGKNAFYETTTTSSYDLYDDADYYAEEAEYYDEGGYSVGNMSTPITETQANASVAANRKLIKTVDMTIETISFDETIANLRQEIAMKDLAASQVAQNAFIQQGFSNEVDQLYNRLNTCPVPTTPVYGRTPIFTCNNGGCGCGNNAFYN